VISYDEKKKCKKLSEFNKVETKMFDKEKPVESSIHGEESPVLE